MAKLVRKNGSPKSTPHHNKSQNKDGLRVLGRRSLGGQPDTNYYCTKTNQPHWLEYIETTLLVAAFLAATSAAIYTKSESEAGWEQVEVSKAVARNELRAYLSIEPASAPIKDSQGRIEVVPVRIFNSGQTPANKLAQRMGAFVATPLRRDEWQVRKTRKESAPLDLGFLAGNGKVIRDIPIITKDAKTGNISRIFPTPEYIKDGGRRLYAVGQVFYRDIFGRDHWTTFCFWWSPQMLSADDARYCKDDNDTEPPEPVFNSTE